MLLPRQQTPSNGPGGASACRPRGARRTRPCGAPRPWHGRPRTATGRSRSPRGHAVRAPAHGGPRHRGGRAAARGGGAPAPARRSQPRRGWPRAGSPLARTAGPAGRKMTRTTRKASWIPHHDVDTAHAGPGAVCRAASDAFRSRPHTRPAAGARSIADRQRQPGESTCRHGRRHPGAFLKGGASRGSSRTSMPARGVRPAAWLAFRRGVAGEQAATGGSHWPCSGRAA
jgi:hypothetical protein